MAEATRGCARSRGRGCCGAHRHGCPAITAEPVTMYTFPRPPSHKAFVCRCRSEVGRHVPVIVYEVVSHMAKSSLCRCFIGGRLRPLPSTVSPPLVPWVRIPCAVVSVFPASFCGTGPCLVVTVDGRGFGSSRVAQLEPFCDLRRRFAPSNDETLPAHEGGVPLSASPQLLTLSQPGKACGARIGGACHGVVHAVHETAWEPIPSSACAVALAVVTD